MLGILLICYLFVGGIGAGTCFITCLLSLKMNARLLNIRLREKSAFETQVRHHMESDFIRRAYAASFACYAIASVLLLADLGRLDRVGLLFWSPTVSFITIGFFSLVTCLFLSLYQWLVGVGLIRNRKALSTFCSLLLILGSMVIMLYTGLLLHSITAVPLWSNTVLPILFLVSSLSGGIALIAIIYHFSDAFTRYGKPFSILFKIDIGVKLVEMITCTAFVAIGYNAGSSTVNPTAQSMTTAMDALLTGSDAELLFGGFIGLGLILPLLFDIVLMTATRSLPLLTIISAGCVLFGGFALRYCIVQAGVSVASSFAGFGG